VLHLIEHTQWAPQWNKKNCESHRVDDFRQKVFAKPKKNELGFSRHEQNTPSVLP
jgi:hypothetical protein